MTRLPRDQFEPIVLTLSPEVTDSLAASFSSAGIELRTLSLGRAASAFFGLRALSNVIMQVKPDIVHSQGLRADVLLAKLTGDSPRLCTIRNFPRADYRFTYGRVLGSVMARAHVGAMRRLNGVVAVSHAVAMNLATRHDLMGVHVVHNGINTQKFSAPSADTRRDLRTKLELPAEARIWIVSGHLSARKDPFFLINAWSKAFGGNEGELLLFLGSGELERQCRIAISELENVRILGRVKNVSCYLRAGNVLVSASRAEGMPNAVLEGLASGMSVLLSDVVPHREVWEMDQRVGELFPVGDFGGFVDAAARLHSVSGTSINHESRRLIEEKLSAAVMSERYQALYYQLYQCTA